MTVPIWMLLGFAAWTLLLLLLTIGIYRWFRVVQSVVHVGFVQTNAVVSIRFSFFFVQFICFVWLIGILVARHA